MAEAYIEGLRAEAPRWSLQGDKHLLDVLQGLHQKIIEKCQETNNKLEEMVTALDDASIDLQNVNNKFTALSNSQFIESRVYDDDGDTVVDSGVQKDHEEPTKQSESENLLRSLEVLDSMHETVTILCDSDSESGTDDEQELTRVVLKPKDLYSERPLPYIIGSQAWKSKWHAGLLADDSDTDSGSTKREPNPEQYSDSEPDTESAHEFKRRSSPSISWRSDLSSERQHARPISVPVSPPTLSQSDVAAELARRCGGGDIKMPVQESPAASPVVRKLYKPQQPSIGVIFSDEPPPLESDQSEGEQDIFAEIIKTGVTNYKGPSVADDLFGRPVDDVDYQPPQVTQSAQAKKPPLFQDEPESDLFVDKPKLSTPKEIRQNEVGTKKPIGGMSLFGSNANAESIGAAILKRKQQASSTSGDESDQETPKIKNNLPKKTVVRENEEITAQKEKQRDIFDDLFARSEKANKLSKEKTKVIQNEPKIEQKPEKKIDLFSDDIFDDIDDIFTTNVKVVQKNDKQKSIFDDDDLFAEVSKVEKGKAENKVEPKNKRNIFSDDDDDLFSDIPKEIKKEQRDFEKQSIKHTKSLFSDSDEDALSDITKVKPQVTENKEVSKETVTNNKTTKVFKDDIFSDDDNLFKDEHKQSDEQKSFLKTPVLVKSKVTSPDIFDDDDDLFKTSPVLSKQTAKIKDDLFGNEIDENNQEKHVFDRNSPKPSQEQDKPFYEKDTEVIQKQKDFNNHEATIAGPTLKRDNDDNNLFKKEQTVIKTTVTTNPASDTPDITEINTKITINPTPETVSVISQTVSDVTINTQVTVVSDKDKHVIAPDIIQDSMVVKPDSIVVKTDTRLKENEENVAKTTVTTVLDNRREFDSNKNITDSIFNDFGTESKQSEKVPAEIKTNIDEDVFSDIFNDIPPVFEKPKEPKRSKNVNALFDDDSDDESLFFKKNDVITDEKPEGFVSNNERLFGLFRDEPPAIDVDFVKKPLKKDVVQRHDIFLDKNESFDEEPQVATDRSLKDEDIFDSPTNFSNKVVQTVNNADENSNTDDIFKNVTEDIFRKPSSPTLDKSSEDISCIESDNNILKTTKIDYKSSFQEEEPEFSKKAVEVEPEPKKIGKLKPMNFNINVNTLLPGASPKKVAKTDKTDGQIQSKSNEELNKTLEVTKDNNFEPKMVKSISFEGDPEAPVLDNKLSKERAKIQVKRRPSTRRARREAVEKIEKGIESSNTFTPDSQDQIDNRTDPSEPSSNGSRTNYETISQHEIIKDKEIDKVEPKHVTENRTLEELIKENNITENRTPEELLKENLDSNSSTIDTYNPKESISELNKKEQDFEDTLFTTRSDESKEVTSKIVYVLHDEDIFDDKPRESSSDLQYSKLLENPTNFEDSFGSEKENSGNGIKTLGKVYKEPSLHKTKQKSFLSDSDDEELFTGAKVSKETTKKTLIVDSDDENLFKFTKTNKTDVSTVEETKPSKNTLVFKESDDEDLFKTTNNSKNTFIAKDTVNEKNTITAKDTTTYETATVFKVSDDEDLFETTNTSKEKDTETATIAISGKDTTVFKESDDEDLFRTTDTNKNTSKEKDTESSKNTITAKYTFDAKNTIVFKESDDEDLFKTTNTSKEKDTENAKNTKIGKDTTVFKASDDEDLFRTINTGKYTAMAKDTGNTIDTQIAKNTSVAKEPITRKTHLKAESLPLFGDSDDDLFKKPKNDQKLKKSVFSSDSDEELFSGKKKERDLIEKKEVKVSEEKTEEKIRDSKKVSLFGDDSDDDLFGAKTRKHTESKPELPKPVRTESTSKPPEPVFSDPLSFLDDDE